MHLRKNSGARHLFAACQLVGTVLVLTFLSNNGLPQACAGQPHGPNQHSLVPLPRKAPAPKDNPTTPLKVKLGKQLFFDQRLSRNNSMSCATCHVPDMALADGRHRAQGAGARQLKRNTPTVLNVGFFSTLFWDGRASSLEEQALIPIQSPDEMQQDLDRLVTELASVPGYARQFQDVFDRPLNKQDIARALAAFQRTLITGDSAFDRFLAGDKGALSPSARSGLETFAGDAGCVRCHNGPLLSDGKYYRIRTGRDDQGRGAVTGEPDDLYKFRTPSLRNVARTAPYMHDGSMETLDDVVTYYYRGVPTRVHDGPPLDVKPRLGNSFSEIPDVVAFLESLTGEPPEVTVPELP